MTFACDREQLGRFVREMFKYSDSGTFTSLRAFDQHDSKAKTVLIRSIKINGSLDTIVDAAEIAINSLAGGIPTVFAPPICTFSNAAHARTEDLANGLVLSVEIDDGDTRAKQKRLESLLGFATMVVASGSTWADPETGEVFPKVHLHWRLDEPTRAEEDHQRLRHARNMAALLVGADPTGKPTVHPLRWPGSWNVKGKPVLAHILQQNDDAEISLSEAIERLELAVEAAGLQDSGVAVSGNPEAPIELVTSAMATIPNPGTEIHYDTWIRMGYATYRATGGTGLGIWDEWSKKSEKYNAEETVAAWRRIHKAVTASKVSITAGAGTIFFHAKKEGWKRPDQDPPETPVDPGYAASLFHEFVEYQRDAKKETGAKKPEITSSRESQEYVALDPSRDWLAPAPLRQWLIDQWIPIGYVTGLYGDGGIGKSLLAQQLLTSTALGMPWLGLDVRAGRALGFMCEDDSSELHRRQEGINRVYGIEMANLENLRISARLGADNLLMTFDQENHGKPSALFQQIDKYMEEFRPRLVVLDTLADIFGGNEINRAHARQFVQGIGGELARKYECAVVIPAHPSASGLSTGSGTSGSTAWNNTFRARLYITRPEGEEDTRLVSRMKANYAPKGGEITVSWQEGAFGIGEPLRPRPEIDWQEIDAIFQEIDRAWKANDPWSSEPQAKRQSRYIATWASIKLGLNEKKVGRLVEKWTIEGFLRMETYDAHRHKRGLKVMRWLQP